MSAICLGMKKKMISEKSQTYVQSIEEVVNVCGLQNAYSSVAPQQWL
jgi:hypothetical protein